MDAKATDQRVGLPANRAFVVQLSAEATGDALFRGRAEHLASGSVVRFESLTELGEFMAGVLEPGLTETREGREGLAEASATAKGGSREAI